jgi:hypothetical protein
MPGRNNKLVFISFLACSNYQPESPGYSSAHSGAPDNQHKFMGQIVLIQNNLNTNRSSHWILYYQLHKCTQTTLEKPLLAKVSHPNSILKSRNFSESVSEENRILITKIVEMIQELLCFDSI